MSSGRAPVDLNLAAGDRGDDRPAAGLDVVAPSRCSAAAAAGRRPSIRSVVLPMPLIPTPSFRRKSHSSTTCGSHAAWRISLRPGAAAAASSAVSVPVTDAS